MTKYLLFALVVISSSCSKRTAGFNQFFDDNREDATLALGVPKWATMPFINKEDRKVIRDLSKGMKSMKVLIAENPNITDKFKDYVAAPLYDQHLYIQDDGEQIEIFTRTEDDNLREIVLSILSDSDVVVVAIQGKTNYQEFLNRISSQL